MAKRKKSAATSKPIDKKRSPVNSKKPTTIFKEKTYKKSQPRLNTQKVEIIAQKMHTINKNFESLIQECRTALNQVS